MKEQEFFEQAEKELEELNQHRADFMTMDFKELNNADYINFLNIGNRIFSEDTTLNVYELYKHPDTRAKCFATIAKIAYHVNNMFQTEERMRTMIDSLELHFQNMVKKLVHQTDSDKLAELLLEIKKDNPNMTAEQESQFIRDIAVSGLLAMQ
ncbi:TPA: hypothetical protein U0688_001851 [Streptococcus suis]|uniref:Uncharacterized protein n=1 Tax=Streptococcus suis TaxID=1307 RepID=A0A7Y6RS98_STRSU|nr:hypothetical protein [Streptococcus suis]QBX11313.1 hypothetical protein JavanS559_0004 [Streptococcus satellite phage Javan559]QBX11481.1 hypothetical protein JavanS581_0005 [Streptococcus satellite phage Javan581]QBX11528.1 hypothetical protein JavanS588_0003 [Streptococcus satellite phage Javan588]QBX11626.1 hypothetical protein JavanS596_0003 [Streptococcus satellite phage Javan596]AEB82413.1 hypothetical protein SSUST3_2004 [Streptococcus suis ST3]